MKKESKKRMNKKAQLTIFIILALAIVIVLILIFIRKPDFGVIVTPKTPIDSIKQCAIEALDDSIKIIISQGGSINPENYYMYNGTKIEYLCYAKEYYQKCVMQKPLLKESVENELKKDLEPKILQCLNSEKDSLARKGYSASFKYPNLTIELIPNNIMIAINTDLRITKDKTEAYKSIKIDEASKLYDLVMIATSIINWEARYGGSEIMNYMMYYPQLRVEKKKQSEGTTIYILTDKNTGERFVFASRSLVIPVGITGS